MNIPQDLETTARAIQTLLQGEIVEALEAVEAVWAATYPLDLGAVATWYLFDRVSLLELSQASFPVVVVSVAEQIPVAESGQWGYGEAEHAVLIEYYTAHTVIETVWMQATRYGAAMQAILMLNRKIASKLHLAGFVPQVELSELFRAYPTEIGSDAGGDEFFTMGGRISFQVQVTYG